jgi:hypothetical protein
MKNAAIAIASGACVALLSFSWSEQCISLGVESAEAAQTNRATHRPSVVGIARQQSRRSVQGHELFAAAVAATTAPRNYDDYFCSGDPHANSGYPPGSYYYSSYSGGYCVSAGYDTGLYARPTLAPRFYGGFGP